MAKEEEVVVVQTVGNQVEVVALVCLVPMATTMELVVRHLELLVVRKAIQLVVVLETVGAVSGAR